MSDRAFDEYVEILRTFSTEEEVQRHIHERKCEKLLVELKVKRTASDIVNLLKDPVRLREATFKVRNKTFL